MICIPEGNLYLLKRKKIDLGITNFKGMDKSKLPREFHDILDLALTWVGTAVTNVVEFIGSEALGLGISWGQLAQYAVSIGLTIYNMCASKDKARSGGAFIPNALDYNGQLVNSRQASDPVRVLYGIVKTGGVWVYSKVSSEDNEILNTIVTWGEGEISGLHTGIDSSPIYSGTHLDDLSTGGEFISPVV